MKHSLKLLAAAVVLALPAASFAGPITFTTPADATTYTYAKELVTTTTNIVPGSTAGALTAVSPKLGFGVSASQTRYIRFDLANGTFGSTAQTVGLTITPSTGGAITTAPSITVIDGGASGDNYVIYQITAGTGLTANHGFEFQLASLLMTDTTVPVTVKYAMFETAAAAAQNAATGKLAESAAPVVVAQTGTGLGMTVTETALANTPTANVTANPAYSIFKSLGAPNASTTVAEPSSVVVKLAALDPATSALPLDMSGFLGTAPKMTLSGASDLTAFKAAGATVSLAVGTDCAAASTAIMGTINTDNTVTFAPTAVQLLGSNTPATGLHLCMKVGTTPAKAITAQSFMLALDTAKNGVVLGPQAAGQIKRNGLVLRAPFFSDAGTSAASINLANLTPSDIKFNVRCLYKGKTEKAGFQDQVLPGAQTKRLYTGTAAAGIGCPTYAGTPATSVSAIELTFETDGIGAVNGTVIRENATTGEVGMSEMTGNTISNPTP